MTKPVRAYLEKQLQDPAFVAEWVQLMQEDVEPMLEWLRRALAEVGETTSLPSEQAEYREADGQAD